MLKKNISLFDISDKNNSAASGKVLTINAI